MPMLFTHALGTVYLDDWDGKGRTYFTENQLGVKFNTLLAPSCTKRSHRVAFIFSPSLVVEPSWRAWTEKDRSRSRSCSKRDRSSSSSPGGCSSRMFCGVDVVEPIAGGHWMESRLVWELEHVVLVCWWLEYFADGVNYMSHLTRR